MAPDPAGATRRAGRIGTFVKTGAIVLALVIAALLGLRAWQSQRGPPLELWHTHTPPELSADELRRADWSRYIQAENAAFNDVHREVTDKLPPSARTAGNRYFSGSPIHPPRFAQDWNRSFVLEPRGLPVGVVVLLHGLTDSPYSVRHLARRYRDDGFLALAIRLPGHGTVPAGLTEVDWEDWYAATHLAIREAHRRAPALPLHLVGYSNGGALAMKYVLDSLADPALPRVSRVVLISPMIGVTELARFAGMLGWPAVLPAFAKAAWLGIVPEFNPYKYNSFPVNAARQSSLLTKALQQDIAAHAAEGRLAALPPILTFQSVVDATVSTQAVLEGLYAHLPANGSELVLFDLNRNAKFGPLLRSNAVTALARLLAAPPRHFRTVIITNASPDSLEVVERATEAGEATEQTRKLGLFFPADVYSLSHVALPFPMNDALYGMEPDPADDFGVHLGNVAMHGERGTLIVGLDALARMSSNPFFAYMQGRIDAGIDNLSVRVPIQARSK